MELPPGAWLGTTSCRRTNWKLHPDNGCHEIATHVDVPAFLSQHTPAVLDTTMTIPTIDQIRQAPKIVLHDHIDGGLRPQTLLELADQIGYGGLPTTESADRLQSAIHHQAQGVDLPTYLSAFRHSTAVLQTPEALERVAEECAADLAADRSSTPKCALHPKPTQEDR